MNGLSIQSAADVGANPGTAWQVKATGDYNGDGKSDILWQNTNGQADVWLMNGLTISSAADVGSNPGSAWKIIGRRRGLSLRALAGGEREIRGNLEATSGIEPSKRFCSSLKPYARISPGTE